MLRLFAALRIVISVLFFSFSFNWLDVDLLNICSGRMSSLTTKIYFWATSPRFHVDYCWGIWGFIKL